MRNFSQVGIPRRRPRREARLAQRPVIHPTRLTIRWTVDQSVDINLCNLGRVVAIDVLDMPPLPGVTFVRGDFTEEPVLRELERVLGGRPVDLVLSDLSPNLSGVAVTDQARSIALAERAVEFAAAHLNPGGVLLVKTFQGVGFPALLRQVRASFERVVSRKPEASRSRSTEMYLLARGPRRSGR